MQITIPATDSHGAELWNLQRILKGASLRGHANLRIHSFKKSCQILPNLDMFDLIRPGPSTPESDETYEPRTVPNDKHELTDPVSTRKHPGIGLVAIERSSAFFYLIRPRNSLTLEWRKYHPSAHSGSRNPSKRGDLCTFSMGKPCFGVALSKV